MSSYTKWDRAAYIERVGGEGEAEQRRKVLMARQSGYQLAEERKRHGLTPPVSCSRLACLSRKPLAPAFSAW
jgi:hypothetical protein